MTTQTDPETNSGARLPFIQRIRSIFQLSPKPQRIPGLVYVIANPAAGQDQPVLKTLNTVFRAANLEWQIGVTHRDGDGKALAELALEAGASLIAAYGGDGTVVDVGSGLLGAGVPLGILPGGTGNMMSKALGIPQDLAEAAALIVSREQERQEVFMGQAGPKHFLQLVGIGMEARMVEGADRSAKDRLGMFAYILAGLKALTAPTTARYHLTLDGNRLIDEEGVTCLIAKTGNLGIPSLNELPETADPHEPLLDVVIIRKADIPSLMSLATTMAGGVLNRQVIPQWTARQVEIVADPPQVVQADGEMLEKTPITVKIIPEPLEIITPPQEAAA